MKRILLRAVHLNTNTVHAFWPFERKALCGLRFELGENVVHGDSVRAVTCRSCLRAMPGGPLQRY